MKAILFAKRNIKEILRDPLSYVFCLGFPVVMLVIFQVINQYSPEAYWFDLKWLIPGITVFSFSFVMLYMTILVSKDRTTSFLTRLYISPMKTIDFIIGYILPGMIIAIAQAIICLITAIIITLITNVQLNILDNLKVIILYLPVMLMFVSFGILFGSLFNDKSAPGVSSIIISANGFISGAWMPLDTMGTFEKICTYFPFYPAVSYGRVILNNIEMTFSNFGRNILVVLIYTIIILLLSIVILKKKMISDNK